MQCYGRSVGTLFAKCLLCSRSMAPTVAPARASGFVGTKLRQPLNPLKVIIIIKYIVILSLSNILSRFAEAKDVYASY